MLEVGELINDRYALIAPIGEGRMAVVWRASDRTLGRDVAIRFLLGYDGPDSKRGVDQFLREARLCASIQHRNVIHTVEFGVLNDRQPFMVMELLNGEDLGARAAREPRLGAGPFIHVITVALRGLAAVHDAGIVHRDLKPRNIFLQRDSDAIYPKILDFGISQSGVQPALVATGDASIAGAPHYMSPEQARGQSGIDKRSDVYSMAVILFQGLSGRLPFDADTAGELIARITTEEPPRLSELCPDLPEPLSDLLAQAMSKNCDHRFADARAMRNAILSAAKTLLPATRRSSPSLAPGPAPAASGRPFVAAQAPSPAAGVNEAQRAGWGDFEGLTRPAVSGAGGTAGSPRPPDVERASSAQLRAARHQSSQQLSAVEPGDAAQPPARGQSSAQRLAAHRQSSQQLSAVAAGTGAEAPAKRASGGKLPAVLPAGGAQVPARHQNSAQLTGRDRNSAQLSGRHQNSAQLPSQRSSGAHRAVQPGAPAHAERTSVAERRDKAMPAASAATRNPIERAGTAAASTLAQSSAESGAIGADALDPLYAGADQAAPEIDFERIRIDTQKASPPRAQPAAAQPAPASPAAGKPRGKQHGRDRTMAPPGVAWRTWALSLIGVAVVAYAYVAMGGLASRAVPGAAADPTATPAASPGVDADLRKMRFQVKARRHNPGHMLPHLRDVEF